MNDCQNCRRVKAGKDGVEIRPDCYGVAYYEAKMIVYCRPQMLWLIEWLDLLEAGKWPEDPAAGEKIGDPKVQRSISPHGAFEMAAMVFADVSSRLKRTGKAGMTLIWEVQHLGVDVREDLARDAKLALDYISGYRARRRSFSKWVSDQERKLEKRKAEYIPQENS